eukprot:GHVL01040543.1.p1 GENE.GHVL01040543.1~~GHVL01040543.1.p1  ORF type:complete len:973 (+),score=315.25 GHVL01040543.1:537-3455(+)
MNIGLSSLFFWMRNVNYKSKYLSDQLIQEVMKSESAFSFQNLTRIANHIRWLDLLDFENYKLLHSAILFKLEKDATICNQDDIIDALIFSLQGVHNNVTNNIEDIQYNPTNDVKPFLKYLNLSNANSNILVQLTDTIQNSSYRNEFIDLTKDILNVLIIPEALKILTIKNFCKIFYIFSRLNRYDCRIILSPIFFEIINKSIIIYQFTPYMIYLSLHALKRCDILKDNKDINTFLFFISKRINVLLSDCGIRYLDKGETVDVTDVSYEYRTGLIPRGESFSKKGVGHSSPRGKSLSRSDISPSSRDLRPGGEQELNTGLKEDPRGLEQQERNTGLNDKYIKENNWKPQYLLTIIDSFIYLNWLDPMIITQLLQAINFIILRFNIQDSLLLVDIINKNSNSLYSISSLSEILEETLQIVSINSVNRLNLESDWTPSQISIFLKNVNQTLVTPCDDLLNSVEIHIKKNYNGYTIFDLTSILNSYKYINNANICNFIIDRIQYDDHSIYELTNLLDSISSYQVNDRYLPIAKRLKKKILDITDNNWLTDIGCKSETDVLDICEKLLNIFVKIKKNDRLLVDGVVSLLVDTRLHDLNKVEQMSNILFYLSIIGSISSDQFITTTEKINLYISEMMKRLDNIDFQVCTNDTLVKLFISLVSSKYFEKIINNNEENNIKVLKNILYFLNYNFNIESYIFYNEWDNNIEDIIDIDILFKKNKKNNILYNRPILVLLQLSIIILYNKNIIYETDMKLFCENIINISKCNKIEYYKNKDIQINDKKNSYKTSDDSYKTNDNSYKTNNNSYETDDIVTDATLTNDELNILYGSERKIYSTLKKLKKINELWNINYYLPDNIYWYKSIKINNNIIIDYIYNFDFVFEIDNPRGGTEYNTWAKLRHRALQAEGYSVICIPDMEWNALPNANSSRSYLKRHILRALNNLKSETDETDNKTDKDRNHAFEFIKNPPLGGVTETSPS